MFISKFFMHYLMFFVLAFIPVLEFYLVRKKVSVKPIYKGIRDYSSYVKIS